MRALISQPMTFWMALAALLVSIATLLHTYRKSRHERQLDSLERRSNLLFKLIEAESKAAIARLNLGYASSVLGRLRSHPLLHSQVADAFRHSANEALQRLQEDQVNLELQFAEIQTVVDALRTNSEKLDDNADSKKIEKLMPEAQRLQAKIDTFSNLVAAATARFENSLKVLDDSLANLQNAASGKESGG
jgi:hypothetical protein